jgi:hypothetical protein
MQSDDATELGKHASHQDRETHSPEDSATKARALGTAADPLERYRALLSDSRSSSSRPPELPLLQELYGDVHAALVDVCCTFLDRLARLLQDEAATSAALGTGEALLQHNIALLTSVREARAVLLDPAQGSLWFPLRKAYAYRSRLAEAEKCYQIAVQAERIARHLATQDVVHDLTSFGRTLASTVSTVRNALLEKELIRVYDLCLMPRLVVAMSAGHGLLAPQVLMEAPLHPEGTEDIPEVAALQSLASTGDAVAMHSPRTLEALCVEMRALCEQSAQQTCSERTQNMRKANRILKKMTGFSVSLRLAFGRRLEQQWKEWLPQDCGLSLLGSLLPAMQDEVVRFQTWFTEALCSMLHLVRVQRAEPSTTVPSLSPGLTSNGSIAEERLSANDASDYSRAFQTVFEALHELLSWTLDVVAFVAHCSGFQRVPCLRQRHRSQSSGH